jgi:tetrahydromethanopterin S-methyltransferase subunit G
VCFVVSKPQQNDLIMATEAYQQQINNELKSMDQRLYDLEEKMSSIDGKLTQVVDAILGNPLTKSGGFVEEINALKTKIETLEEKVEKQEEFKKRVAWTVGIVVGALMLVDQLGRILNNFT